ncbi:MAG: magnesium transporter [Planctomycetota bacterium]
MVNPLLAPELLELLDAGDIETLREVVTSVHPAEMAEYIAALDDADIWRLLGVLEQPHAAEIFCHFDLERQTTLAAGANRQAMARMLEALPHDDRADLVQRLDPRVAEEILPLVAKAEREDIRKLVSYRERTAGALMSSDYATLRPDLTVAQALEQVRGQAPTRETIYYIYVLDEAHRLIGFVSLKDLILARPTQTVRDVMHQEVLSVEVGADQEVAARRIEKYDLLALPVVDADGKLVGIITHDDALDVLRQESQEDLEKFMAIGGRHEAGEYLRTPAWTHFRKRANWIIVLAALGLVSGMIIHGFEDTLTAMLILALYMPMVADTGGNTGSQSATVVVRALALGEIAPRDTLRILAKELRVSVLLAVVLGLLSFGKVMFLSRGSDIPGGFSLAGIGACIAIALALQVVTATLIGALLPLIAARLKFDPAVVASPALTTIVDITGLLIYFSTAKLLLRI